MSKLSPHINCRNGCGRPRTGKKYCDECGKIKYRERRMAYATAKNAEYFVSDYTEQRREPAVCPRCECDHTVYVNRRYIDPIVTHRAYCESCKEYFRTEEYDTTILEECSVGYMEAVA